MEVTSFAGVFFLVLILLLLHSSFAPAPGVRIQLPSVAAERRPATLGAELVVAIDQNGLTYFEHQVVTTTQLRERLTAKVQASRKPVQLLLLADESVRQGAVIALATIARESGINEVVMATREPLFQAGPGTPVSPP